ncbi:MAG: hypothetical protein H6934_03655 [Burkholderiaceae bacterium]|nr:hypothetical protein [Burkholderiaceae bacterium]
MSASIRLLCSRVLYPAGLTVLAAFLSMATPARAVELGIEGGSGGALFRSMCTGAYVVGISLRSGGWVDAIGLKCGTFVASEGRFKRPPWNTPYHGGSGGSPQVGICPGERYVSAIRVDFTREGTKPKFLDFVEMTCSPISVGDPVKLCLHTGHGCWSRHPTQNPAVFIESRRTRPCPPGQAAIGIHGRAGKFVDAIGLICGPRPVKATAAAPAAKPVFKGFGKRPHTASAKNDVDVYDGPGGNYRVIGIMRKGQNAAILQFHQDGWCKLRAVAAGRDGWVARDHLTRCP